MEGTDAMLPSQCQVTYTIVATVYGNSSKAQVIHNLVVLPQKESIPPTNPCISVSIRSTLEMFWQRLFSCGELPCLVNTAQVASDETLTESALGGNHVTILAANQETFHFSRGQVINVSVNDTMGVLSSPNSVWMVRFIERLAWTAQERGATHQHSCDVCANQEPIPNTLRCTYDNDPKSLLKVYHDVIIYSKRKEGEKEVIIAATQPIPARII